MAQASRLKDIPGIDFIWEYEKLYLGGAPSIQTFEELKNRGITKVINLRGDGEASTDEDKDFCEKNSIAYHHIPVMGPEGLKKDSMAQINQLIEKNENVFIHCASGNRVAGWLITYLVQNEGLDFEAAVEIAQNAGLRSVDFIYQAQDSLESM